MRWMVAVMLCLLGMASSPVLAQQPRPGDLCTNAIPVAVPTIVTGNTERYRTDLPPLCGPAAISADIWYTLIGTGFPVTAHTCYDTYFDTILYIFSGDDCDDLTCIAYVDDACGGYSMIQWPTQAGVRYFVMVAGVQLSRGQFALALEGETPHEDCDGDGVDDPTQIAANPALDCFNPAAVGQTGGPDGRLDACQCPANWNRDDAVNSSDISAFLTSWLLSSTAGNADADIDCSGATNSTDIAAFLTKWLAAMTSGDPADGCP